MADVIWVDGGARNPKAPTLFQVADVDTGVIKRSSSDLVRPAHHHRLVRNLLQSVTDAIKPGRRLDQIVEEKALGSCNGDELEAPAIKRVFLLDRLDREPAITPATVAGVVGAIGDEFVVFNLN